MTEENKVTPPPVYLPPEWKNADVASIQALVNGRATREQQKRALAYIVYDICRVNDVEYRPDSRDHAFASGRRFVGLQINKMISINLEKFMDQEKGEK